MPTACFTGHRKLGDAYYNRHNPSPEWHTLRQHLDLVNQEFIKDFDVNHFISGLAIGVDMLAAESVAYVRTLTPDLPVTLTGAMPFPSQPNKWPEPTRQHWNDICTLCDEVVATSADPYHPSKMQIRNIWMVDASNYVIAIWDGTKSGGTWNCIKYALSTGKLVFAIQAVGVRWEGSWLPGDYK